MDVPNLQNKLFEAIRPPRSDIAECKAAILNLLGDGRERWTGEVLGAVVNGFGALPPGDKIGLILLSEKERPEKDVNPGHPILFFQRLITAAREALAELCASGMAIPVLHGPPTSSDKKYWPKPEWEEYVRISYDGHTTASIDLSVRRPDLPEAVRLNDALRDRAVRYFDPDLFSAGIDALNLDNRTLRLIEEALAAFRRELYIATATLLGAAVEGAWFAAASRFKAFDSKLAKMLEDELTNVSQLQAQLLKVMSHDKYVQPLIVNDLASFAALMRDIRNYGAHPRWEIDLEKEGFFTEEMTGLLITWTRRHLQLFTEAVEIAYAKWSAASDSPDNGPG